MTRSKMMTIVLIVCLVALGAAAWLMFGTTGAGLSYADAEKYSIGETTVAGAVENLFVDWTEGQVNVEYHTGSGIIISETANRSLSEDDRLRWWLDGTTLRIRYAKPGFRISWNLNKQLTVSLPEGTVLRSADIGSTSGNLHIPALAAEEIQLASTSGDITAATDAKRLTVSATSGDMDIRQSGDLDSVRLTSTSGSIACTVGTVKELTADSTSGGVSLNVSGNAESIRIRSTSGSIYPAIASADKAEFSSTSGSVNGKIAAFRTLKIDTTSGSVSVQLPAEPGFTCRVSTTSGQFSSDLALAKDGDMYTCGDGSSACSISSTSGNIRIEQVR